MGCGPNAFGHRVIDVIADQIHQGEGTHAEAAEFGHGPIDGGHISHAFLEDADRLSIEWASDPVDNESRRVLRQCWLFAPLPHEGKHLISESLPALQGRHHFHQGQEWSRVEEVESDEPIRVLQASGQCRNGKGRGVGRNGGIR